MEWSPIQEASGAPKFLFSRATPMAVQPRVRVQHFSHCPSAMNTLFPSEHDGVHQSFVFSPYCVNCPRQRAQQHLAVGTQQLSILSSKELRRASLPGFYLQWQHSALLSCWCSCEA